MMSWVSQNCLSWRSLSSLQVGDKWVSTALRILGGIWSTTWNYDIRHSYTHWLSHHFLPSLVYGDIVGNQYSQPPVWYFILISYLYHASRITIIAIKYTMYSTIVVAHINSKPTVGRGFKLERFNWLGSLWITCEVKITSEYLADKPYWDWHITSHSHQIWLQIILSWSLLDWFQFLQFWRSAANVGGKREEGGGRTRGEVNINNCSWWRGGVSLSLSLSP